MKSEHKSLHVLGLLQPFMETLIQKGLKKKKKKTKWITSESQHLFIGYLLCFYSRPSKMNGSIIMSLCSVLWQNDLKYKYCLEMATEKAVHLCAGNVHVLQQWDWASKLRAISPARQEIDSQKFCEAAVKLVGFCANGRSSYQPTAAISCPQTKGHFVFVKSNIIGYFPPFHWWSSSVCW